MDQAQLEKMILEVMQSMASKPAGKAPASAGGKKTVADYPLGEKMADEIKTPTGVYLKDITMDKIMSGKITAKDVKIAPETLEYQAQVAEAAGRDAFAKNLRRASELIAVPDERILEIYNALRPYRSTKEELLAIADELENKYGAVVNARLVKEAAEIYENRGRLKELS